MDGKFGSIPLKDHNFGSISLLSHLHVGPHESMTCGVHGIYLKFGSFNGIDPIVPIWIFINYYFIDALKRYKGSRFQGRKEKQNDH
jgi:hypothetical protein